MTETSPAAILQERGDIKYASVGHPISNTHAKIVDIEDENKILGPNEVYFSHLINLCQKIT